MTINGSTKTASRETAAIFLLIGSVAFVFLSIVTSVVIGASEPFIAIAFAACLFSILPIMAILRILRIKTIIQKYDFHRTRGGFFSVRTLGVLFGILMLFFIIGGALGSYEIYELDIPGGILIAIGGFLALAGSAIYQPAISPPIQFTNTSPTPQTYNTPTQSNQKEIIHEHEIIVKMRCQYCGYTFDEKLDQCPTCGAKK